MGGGAAGGGPVRRARLVATLVAALMLPAAARAQDDRILVVPFELERFDARVGWLSEGVAVGLTTALEARGVAVVPRDERLAAFERLQLPASAALTRATLIKVAELVGADRVVLGTVREADGQVTIAPRVLDVAKAILGESAPVTAAAADLIATFSRMAVGLEPGPPTPTGTPAAPPTPAFESYVRGLLASAPDVQERLLVQALTLAPRFDAARAALWDAQTARGAHDAALRTATAAPAGGTNWAVRAASSLVHLRRWDEAFTRLTASSAAARTAEIPTLLGVIQLRRGGTPQTGRATYYFNQAVERDAASADACFNLGYAYWLDKDAMAASYWLREAVRRNPADGDAHYVLAAALMATGAGPEAERERELSRRLSERWETATGDSVPRGLERLPETGRRTAAWLDSVLNAGALRDRREAAAFQLEAARRAYDAGTDQEAIRAVQRALYSTPYDVEALQLLARAQARSGLVQEAIVTYKIAIWSAESALLHVELGDALLRAHDTDGARRAAERALVLSPGHAGALDLLRRASAPPGA